MTRSRTGGRRTGVRPAPELARVPTPPFGSKAFFAQVGREMLAATVWFDPGSERISGPVVIRFFGHRKGIGAKPQPGDQFVQDERIDGVRPDNGPVSVTTRVRGINPGEWIVSAKGLPADPTPPGPRGGTGRDGPTLHPGGWSWRSWSFREQEASPQSVKTCFEPLALVPGVVPGVWAALALVGLVVALVMQQLVLTWAGLPTEGSLGVSLVAIAAGLIGGKGKYILEHRGRFDGWAVQGFLAATVVVGIAALALAGIAVGPFVDASTPGILAGLGIGRIGCFFAGCCRGRPTGARWGLWSSDQRVGMRRVPTQLLEAALALALAPLALAAVLAGAPLRGGIFVAALALHTLLRQGIMRHRAERPVSVRGGALTAAAAAAVLVADLAYLALSRG